MNALDAEATAVRNARWRTGVVAGAILLVEKDGQCADGAAACTLQIELSGDPRPRPFAAVTLMPKARIGLEALRGYVGKLKSIVEADTVGEVAEALETLALSTIDAIEDAEDPDDLLHAINSVNQQLDDDLARLRELVDHAEKAARVAERIAREAGKLAELRPTLLG